MSETINRNHLTETLAQFGPLWEVLTDRERTRLVNLLLESVVVDASGSHVRLEFGSSVPVLL